MTKKDITVQIKGGLDARPGAMLVQIASQFESSVYIETENKRINAKSIMGMMSLGIAKDAQLTVITEGADEEQALEAIDKYLSVAE
ncbi:MAG: HPr family phosphocarrier protein [Lachnospiraceae bacterium]|nr:HPr family phosphocarrier protein [Lachnospiraceae bacterium]